MSVATEEFATEVKRVLGSTADPRTMIGYVVQMCDNVCAGRGMHEHAEDPVVQVPEDDGVPNWAQRPSTPNTKVDADAAFEGTNPNEERARENEEADPGVGFVSQ